MHLKYCQEDLGGELFSLAELFPNDDCGGRFLNYIPNLSPGQGKLLRIQSYLTGYQFEKVKTDRIFSKPLIDVVSDHGTVQNVFGQLLAESSEQFWVNARSISSPALYKYQGDSERPTFHMTLDHNGDCLTYSSDSGNLNTAVRKGILQFVITNN